MFKKLLPEIIILVAFVAISFLYINDPLKTQRSGYRSIELRQIVKKEGDVTRIDYIDDDGVLQIAADVGYATKLTNKQNNKEIETYLDDRGKHISRYSGYYGILREYDTTGNNYRITYLDEKNDPVLISQGYAVEERIFNECGQQISSKYLDTEGKPVLSRYNGFGARYEYDDRGHRVKITYLDEEGEPLILSSGYCSVVREYYETDGPENGKVRKEYYFLPGEVPVSLSLGQYGIYKEYDVNGQNSLVTYLDADGCPMVTNKGYTTVTYTYYADNSVQSTLYYDINGNPFRMSEGQYGTKIENGKIVYLNADGTEQFNIKNFAYSNSRFVIVIAIALVVIATFAGKRLNWLMLIIYIVIIIYFTLMFRDATKPRIGILHSYRHFLTRTEARTDIIRNIWLFIPFGTILFRVCPRKAVLLLPFMLSVSIEIIQYFKGVGLCELDDVISNGLGCVIGYEMGYLMQMIRKQMTVRHNAE